MLTTASKTHSKAWVPANDTLDRLHVIVVVNNSTGSKLSATVSVFLSSSLSLPAAVKHWHWQDTKRDNYHTIKNALGCCKIAIFIHLIFNWESKIRTWKNDTVRFMNLIQKKQITLWFSYFWFYAQIKTRELKNKTGKGPNLLWIFNSSNSCDQSYLLGLC